MRRMVDVLSMQINNTIFTVHLRWGIGVDVEATGAPVPTIIYDGEGTVESCMYNGWSLRIPFFLISLGVISD